MANLLNHRKNVAQLVDAFLSKPELRESANLIWVTNSHIQDPLRDPASFSGEQRQVLDRVIVLLNRKRGPNRKRGWDAVMAFPLSNPDAQQLEMASLYRVGADLGSIFALVSLSETFGMGPWEARRCGLPAIITQRAPVLRNEPQPGVLFRTTVDPNDSRDIAQKILELLSKENWSHVRDWGLAQAKRLTWTQTAKVYEEVLWEVASTSGHQPTRPYRRALVDLGRGGERDGQRRLRRSAAAGHTAQGTR